MARNIRPPTQAIVRERLNRRPTSAKSFIRPSSLNCIVESIQTLLERGTSGGFWRSPAHRFGRPPEPRSLENASWHICAYGLTDPHHADLSHSAIASIMAWNSGFASSSRFVLPELSVTSKGSLRTRIGDLGYSSGTTAVASTSRRKSGWARAATNRTEMVGGVGSGPNTC